MMSHWKLSDIPWDRFDAAKVDDDLLKLAKTASLVEYNSADYAQYLVNVFQGDEEFKKAALEWATEEIQHGLALKGWAERADPSFDFEASLKAFTSQFKVPVGSDRSVRGSLSRELVARCVVESGTHSYYTALADASEEPVLKEICRRIAMDEARHFRLFFDHLQKYLAIDKLNVFSRLKVALERTVEAEDAELASAYVAAHAGDASFEGKTLDESSKEYLKRAYGIYRPDHLQRGLALVLKASGVKASQAVTKAVSYLGWFLIRFRYAV